MSLIRTDVLCMNQNKEHRLDRSSLEDKPLELIRRIAAGDEAALRELYHAYGHRLYAYALRLTRRATVAEDVLQESLVAVWQGARNFRGEGRVIAWLLGIVHHKALNALRRKLLLLVGEEPAEMPGETATLEEQIVGREQADLLRMGLDSLSLNHRMVLELVFYQGLQLNEVAEICGCPLGTVKSRLSYAKDHLRRVLEQAGLTAEDVR